MQCRDLDTYTAPTQVRKALYERTNMVRCEISNEGFVKRRCPALLSGWLFFFGEEGTEVDLPEVKGLCCFSFDFVLRQEDVDFCCFLELVCAQGLVLLPCDAIAASQDLSHRRLCVSKHDANSKASSSPHDILKRR